ncbi:50S ribosomal protein L4 [Magnetofaba australis]|uniref:Large ribosomal subunit protein uL4 n=1 Tax=Magnetofaba australis IT-1 TaxID=1434232 RepID=A0A1Y2K318_9PROT|nr:50S ribosomal protein L4 [Magnetofaba australis]OSM02450.1 putative 50S ribosomal protein L4P [Magnetofaba australis IT-1]
MISYPVKDIANQELRSAELSETVFGRELRTDLLGLAVTYQLAKRRSGAANSKGRSEIKGGGKKPYRQKGTGNARQGTTRAPQFRTGGIVFGPKPRDFAVSMNKKMRRLALQVALSAKCNAKEMVLLDALTLDAPKTKTMRGVLDTIEAGKSALVVIAESDRNVELAARNLPGVTVLPCEGVNVYDLLRHDNLVITEAAVKKLEERLS